MHARDRRAGLPLAAGHCSCASFDFRVFPRLKSEMLNFEFPRPAAAGPPGSPLATIHSSPPLGGLSIASSPRPRHRPDPRVPVDDKLTGPQCGLLKIRRVGGKDLPARHFLSENADGSHIGELAAQTRVVFLRGSEPHSVVCRALAFVPEDQDNFVLNIDRQASEHGARMGRRRGNRVEHKLMRNNFALVDGKEGVIQKSWVAMRSPHRLNCNSIRRILTPRCLAPRH